MNLEFKSVNKERWEDFEMLFECKGAPHHCWCSVWRPVDKKIIKLNNIEKKTLIKKSVGEDIPIGILGYLDGEPIAWSSIAPRETYRKLNGSNNQENVWSLVCFFIKRQYRKKGIINLLIEESIKYAKENGAKYVEAYPVDPDSPSYRFMGFKQSFEKANFEFIKKAGKRRNVMIYEIK